MASRPASPGEAAFHQRVQALARSAGAARVDAVERIAGGRNNRAYRVDTPERTFFLKVYHSDPDDPRPRLRTEIAFLQFAWDAGIRCVPEPLAVDHDNDLGLFAFVGGRQLGAEEIAAGHVDQAVHLIKDLNLNRNTATASVLPAASEACFSIAAHLDLVDARVRHLEEIESTDAISGAAQAFVRERLQPAWQSVSQQVRTAAAECELLNHELPASDRCLSPSDFGFHNAILQPTGRLVFHDFEYAGWDDGAKLVCDFLCQPELPVPAPLVACARDGLLAAVPAAPSRERRIELLLPVFLIKWSCICLNDFMPAAARRRAFAAADAAGDRRREQLAKATNLLERAGKM